MIVDSGRGDYQLYTINYQLVVKERGDIVVDWILRLLVFSVSVFIVAKVFPAVYVRSFGTAVLVSLVYGVLKLLLFRLLVLLSFPLVFVTFGLFLIVINAFLLWITDKLIEGFKIRGVLMTLIASVLISVLDIVLRWVIPGI